MAELEQLLYDFQSMALDYVDTMESLVMDDETHQLYMDAKERYETLTKELEKLQNKG
jgi:hypothetical protein